MHKFQLQAQVSITVGKEIPGIKCSSGITKFNSLLNNEPALPNSECTETMQSFRLGKDFMEA
jgi:hypothetical protein